MLNTAVAEIDSHEILIANGSDVLGLIYAYDADNLILHQRNIALNFLIFRRASRVRLRKSL